MTVVRDQTGDLAPATRHAIESVIAERERQEQKCAEMQRKGLAWHTCADPHALDDEQRLPILGEEFGEVCRELCDSRAGHYEPNLVKLRDELVQLAAVAVAWVEAVDARMVEAATEAA